MVISMKLNFSFKNNAHEWLGIISLLLFLAEPWVAIINMTYGIALAGTGIIGISTYLESLSYFNGALSKKILLLFTILIAFILEAIYTFMIFMLFKK